MARPGDVEGRPRIPTDSIGTVSLIKLVVVPFLAAGALAVPFASAASSPWKTVTVSRHSGPVSATMTFQRRTRGSGFNDFRRLRLVVQVGDKTVVDRLLCANLRCSPGSHHDLALQNVYDGPLREAVMSVFTGGAHCCFESLIALVDGPHRGRLIDKNWGDPGYEGQVHDGQYEFITNDDRFAYAFTSFAASGMPAQVFTINPSGKLVDITRARLDLVRKDSKEWWHAYLSFRGKPDGDIRGVLAAWCADEYQLGDKGACTAELHKALARHWLVGPSVWPQNKAYIAALSKMLAKWGYKG